MMNDIFSDDNMDGKIMQEIIAIATYWIIIISLVSMMIS